MVTVASIAALFESLILNPRAATKRSKRSQLRRHRDGHRKDEASRVRRAGDRNDPDGGFSRARRVEYLSVERLDLRKHGGGHGSQLVSSSELRHRSSPSECSWGLHGGLSVS